MKLKAKRTLIHDAFRTTSKVILQSAGKTIPQEIKVTADENGSLCLYATDLERSIRTSLQSSDIQVETPGQVAVPGQKAMSILGALEDEEVSLTLSPEGNFLEITGAASEFKINASPVDEFPPFPEPSWSEPITMPAKAFQDMVDRSAFAAAHEKIHFSLHGVFVRLEKNSIRMVGTDGRRLAIANGKVERSGKDVVEMIVPTKGIKMFQDLVGDEEKVSLSLERNQLFLRTETVEAGTLLIDGKYPEYDKAVPKGNTLPLKLDREEFFSGLRKASVFADADAKGVWFKLEPGKLVLFSNTAGTGEAQVEIKAAYDGDSFEIQFNPDFIRHARKLIDSAEMTVLFKDHKTAALFHESDAFTYVVMPIVKK